MESFGSEQPKTIKERIRKTNFFIFKVHYLNSTIKIMYYGNGFNLNISKSTTKTSVDSGKVMKLDLKKRPLLKAVIHTLIR